MTPRAFSSLAGVLLGFPLLVRREKKPPLTPSEVLLQQAQQQMREAQAKNRGRAVQAITQKNNLQALADQTQKRVDRLTEKAEAAESLDDRKNLLKERNTLQESLTEMQGPLASAIATAEAVKLAMRREEEHVRVMTAEALALRATEKQAQIEIHLAKARLALTTNLATDLFVQAREKIRRTKAERDLITRFVQTVETLDAAAQEAASEDLRQKLIASRGALRDSALNAALWKE